MYWDSPNNRPAANNPWLNPEARHPFNVGYDFNHESTATQEFVDRVLAYWVQEFRFDGYRMDLSKGFTQNFTTDAGVWSQYDASRIELLKRLANVLWSKYPETYIILEHFADNREERELEAFGFMLWGNANFNFNEATMGYNEDGKSDFTGISYVSRGWQNPHLVGYMESHDEERLMYKNLQFGNGSGGYTVQNLETALDRIALAATFFFTVPGPKMLWQFGELGYEVPIDQNGRTGPKPIRWEYFQEPARKELYDTFAQLIHLKQNNPVFRTRQFLTNFSPPTKRLLLQGENVDVIVLGNFDVIPRTVSPGFTRQGTWYEFFSGDSLENNASLSFTFEPGEYRLYASSPLSLNAGNPTVSNTPEVSQPSLNWRIFPNPVKDELFVLTPYITNHVARFSLFSLEGTQILSEGKTSQINGEIHFAISLNKYALSPGIYLGKFRNGRIFFLPKSHYSTLRVAQ